MGDKRRSRWSDWLTTLLLRHKLVVVLSWLAILIIGVLSASTVDKRLSDSIALPGQAGYEANQAILDRYQTGAQHPAVPVITLPAGTTVDEVEPQLSRAFAAVAEATHARTVSYPSTGDRRFVSPDERVTFGLVFPPGAGGLHSPDVSRAATDAMTPHLPPGAQVRVTGIAALAEEGNQEGGASSSVVELALVGALGALAVLAFVFGSFLALTPLLVAAVSIFGIFVALLGLTTFADVNAITVYLVALIGLGVAIDYSLLLVTRWREEHHHGYRGDEAIRRTMATAGRAVVLSALTVAVGLLSMVALPVPFLRSIGYSGMLIPLVSGLVTLTLLPVVLAVAGRRLDWPRLRKEASASRRWTAWTRGVIRLRWPAAVAGIGVLVLLAFFAQDLKTGSPQSEALASSGPTYEGLVTLRESGIPTGVLSPVEVLVPGDTDGETVANRLAEIDGVWHTVAPQEEAWRQAGTSLVLALPTAESGTDEGRATIERIRQVADDDLTGVRVGGVGAQDIDFGNSIYGSFPLMLGIIALVGFALLLRAFRSVLLAVKAVLIDLLSIAAVLGGVVLVWQQGHGSDAIWSIPATGSVPAYIPLLIFAFLFGLTMDYEVFILTRMREEYDRTGATEPAIVEGIGRTGRLVTSAALILFFAFAALAAAPSTEVKVFASALGVGILLDATVVRSLLVPALVSILGRFNWWPATAAPRANELSQPGPGPG